MSAHVLGDGLVRYRARVHWLDTQTGKTGVYEETPDDFGGTLWVDEDGINPFMWEDGNYSCDCNRALMFLNLDIFTDEHPCGDGRFRVVKIEALNPDGTVVPGFDYSEAP